jgi:RNA polymerase sigma factor (TIGR02999 family)
MTAKAATPRESKRPAVTTSFAPAPGSITELIHRANQGEQDALNRLFSHLYTELHDMARARVRRHAPITVLDTTALLHESYLRLVKVGALSVENRAHFLAYAARVMRSIIVDFARQRLAARRGGGAIEVPLDTEAGDSASLPEADVVRVHEALEQLAAADERLVRLVEMRYFGGLTEDEIAEALNVSTRTVQRDWEKARLLLAIALK